MNNILGTLLAGSKNPHVSVPLLLAVLLEILPHWLPAYAAQLQETQKVLVAYGLLAASTTANGNGNGKPPTSPAL